MATAPVEPTLLDPSAEPVTSRKSRRRNTSHLKLVPETKALREGLRARCAEVTARLDKSRPIGKDELESIARRTLDEACLAEGHLGWTMVALATSFWRELATRSPERFGPVAFSGLLRQDARAALQLLPSLPDDEAVADAVYVILGQHAQLLNLAEVEEVVVAARAVATACKPTIRTALNDWIDEQHSIRHAQSPAPSRQLLDSALSAVAARRNETYKPAPRAARLLQARSQAA